MKSDNMHKKGSSLNDESFLYFVTVHGYCILNRCLPQNIYNPESFARHARVIFNFVAISTAMEVGRDIASIMEILALAAFLTSS